MRYTEARAKKYVIEERYDVKALSKAKTVKGEVRGHIETFEDFASAVPKQFTDFCK